MWTFKMETIVKACDVLVSHAVWSVLRCREELLGKEGGACTVTASESGNLIHGHI